MQVEQVVSILDSLDGAPPEVLAGAEAQEAISMAAALLKQRPSAAGARWTDEEDVQLIAEFEAGTTLPAIAQLHHRSRAAIELRLVKLGKLDAQHATARGRR